MTRSQIIEQLFLSKNFNDCINKMDPDYLREDLKQEIILIVCEWDDDKIINLHNRGELEFFVVRVIINQIKSNTSPFAKKYRTFNEQLPDNDIMDDCAEIENQQLQELKESFAVAELDKLPWYNKGLIQLYLKHGNYRAIEKLTGIPFVSCYKTIKKSLNSIKQKIPV